jgi:hypothetical protein
VGCGHLHTAEGDWQAQHTVGQVRGMMHVLCMYEPHQQHCSCIVVACPRLRCMRPLPPPPPYHRGREGCVTHTHPHPFSTALVLHRPSAVQVAHDLPWCNTSLHECPFRLFHLLCWFLCSFLCLEALQPTLRLFLTHRL